MCSIFFYLNSVIECMVHGQWPSFYVYNQIIIMSQWRCCWLNAMIKYFSFLLHVFLVFSFIFLLSSSYFGWYTVFLCMLWLKRTPKMFNMKKRKIFTSFFFFIFLLFIINICCMRTFHCIISHLISSSFIYGLIEIEKRMESSEKNN